MNRTVIILGLVVLLAGGFGWYATSRSAQDRAAAAAHSARTEAKSAADTASEAAAAAVDATREAGRAASVAVGAAADAAVASAREAAGAASGAAQDAARATRDLFTVDHFNRARVDALIDDSSLEPPSKQRLKATLDAAEAAPDRLAATLAEVRAELGL